MKNAITECLAMRLDRAVVLVASLFSSIESSLPVELAEVAPCASSYAKSGTLPASSGDDLATCASVAIRVLVFSA